MKIRDTEAVILAGKDYGESDRLVFFYSRSGGRLTGMAKGAKRSRRRFVNSLESFSLVEISYRERRSLVWLEGSRIIDLHEGLRRDIERWGYAALAGELFLEMVPEGESQPELFTLLTGFLERLVQDKDPVNVLLLFVLRFLDLLGYLPVPDGCTVCGRSLRDATRWRWGMDRGILVCPDHVAREGDIVLDLGTLLLMERLRSLPPDKIWRLRVAQGKRSPLLRGLIGRVRCYTGRDLKTLRLLRQVLAD